MKHSNVIDLFKVCSVTKTHEGYGIEFNSKHVETMYRIREMYHKRADAQKRRAV